MSTTIPNRFLLTPADGEPGDLFGYSVALSADGRTAILGGFQDDVGDFFDQGSGRVLDWDGSDWVQRGEAVTPADGEEGDWFGYAVALSADGLIAIVGGIDYVGSNVSQGSARIFAWDGSAWVERGAPLTAGDGEPEDYFGTAVALSADGLTAIVGGYGDDVGVNPDQGSARVFTWDGRDWAQRGADLTPADGEAGDFFGYSVALSANGRTAILGGVFDQVGDNFAQGSARVFVWDGSDWSQRGGALTPADGEGGDGFGLSVALSADGLTAIVGGDGDDVGANRDQGSARVFVWDGSAWAQRGGALTPADGAEGDRFGQSVALSADGLTAIVGGWLDDVGGKANQGSARVFDWDGSDWVQRGALLTPVDGEAGDRFGWSVALSADGQTALVGGFGDTVDGKPGQGSGRVFVWNGSSWDGAPSAGTAPVVTSTSIVRTQEGAGGVLYIAGASDAEGDTITWTLGGIDAGRFVLEPLTGVLAFRVPPDFEWPLDEGRDNVYDITLTAFDGALSSAPFAVTITVTNRPEVQVGTNGNDRLAGGPGDDAIFGRAGNDTLTGEVNDDQLSGGADNDSLDGGPGTDRLLGEDGNDTLRGGAEADTLIGGAGDDLYFVASWLNQVVEEAAGGIDTVVRTGGAYTLGDHVENLEIRGGTGARGTGNALDNLMTGGRGDDTLGGAAGDDTLRGGGGNDSLRGDAGLDRLEGGAGDDTLRGGTTADTLVGGAGDDWYFVPVAANAVIEEAGGGIDTVVRTAGTYTLGAHVEKLLIQGATGASGTGNGLDNLMTGGSGDDTLRGVAGDDTLVGGVGADSLLGGAGADVFRYLSAADSTGALRDTIGGFELGADRIDLSAIDTDVLAAGDQGFAWLGDAAFTGMAGELRRQAEGADTLLLADLDGDGAADMAMLLAGSHALTAATFIL